VQCIPTLHTTAHRSTPADDDDDDDERAKREERALDHFPYCRVVPTFTFLFFLAKGLCWHLRSDSAL
jgi:hypothetical protein